jgi:uncharacterized protein YaaQ
MKMIVAIIRDSDNEAITQALIASDFRVTRIASTGGFLRRGSSTLMIGVADERVDEAIQVVRDNLAPPDETGAQRATLFVLPIEDYSQV